MTLQLYQEFYLVGGIFFLLSVVAGFCSTQFLPPLTFKMIQEGSASPIYQIPPVLLAIGVFFIIMGWLLSSSTTQGETTHDN